MTANLTYTSCMYLSHQYYVAADRTFDNLQFVCNNSTMDTLLPVPVSFVSLVRTYVRA